MEPLLNGLSRSIACDMRHALLPDFLLMSSCPMSTLLAPKLRQGLEHSGNVTCVIDDALKLIYCNPAWDKFALSNNGESAVAARVIGTNLLDVVAEPMRALYDRLFAVARNTRQIRPLDYECSSASVYRLFRMEIRPLGAAAGFALVHALRVERPHDPYRESFSPDAVRYLNPQGLIIMCAHCRKTMRVAEPAIWDWVPQHLDPTAPRGNISHGLCDPCLAYFYPASYKGKIAKTGRNLTWP